MSFVSLRHAATRALVATYAVEEGAASPTPVVSTVGGCVERGYGGPRGPRVRDPEWVWHEAPDGHEDGAPVTDAASLAVLTEHWAMDRDEA